MQGLFAQSPEALEERCTTFVGLHVWPLKDRLNWTAWLLNFPDSQELFYARCLLESFLYFSEDHADALLRSAFHALSRDVCGGLTLQDERRASWRGFLGRVLITYVEGEHPSPTDSGLSFARRARKVLGIPEERIVRPERAVQLLQRDETIPVVFLDDFLGSGRQFEATWSRAYAPVGASFASLAASHQLTVTYVPLLASTYGLDRVTPLTRGATIHPGHALSARYSAKGPDSAVWPDGKQAEGVAFVEAVSKRAGYQPSDCWGFHGLGLCVAILDTIPDSSLPLFYSNRNNWRPLMVRR